MSIALRFILGPFILIACCAAIRVMWVAFRGRTAPAGACCPHCGVQLPNPASPRCPACGDSI